MAPRSGQSGSQPPRAHLHQIFAAVMMAAISVVPVHAKEAPLTAIEIYNGPNGPSYVQISDVLINGKSEMRSCGDAATIDRSSYGRLAKVTLATGMSLDYRTDGVLTLTNDSSSSCVVPINLKLDKNQPTTPAELATKAVLQGRVISAVPGSSETPSPLVPGVKLVFVAQPDMELAEYLRAERASSITVWQDYVGKYPTSPHIAPARDRLASLLVKEGEASLANFKKSSSDASPQFSKLKEANLEAKLAMSSGGGGPAADQLKAGVRTELETLTSKGNNEVQAYRQALASHSPGYGHLVNAQKLSEGIIEVEPTFPASVALQKETNDETGRLEASLRTAESMLASKRYDEAYAALGGYRIFVGEAPRITTVVDSDYQFHYDQGQGFVAAQKWQEAVSEFQRAVDIKKTAESQLALKNATDELVSLRNKSAAEVALQQSREYGQQRLYIRAYELLADLPAAQQPLVADELERLKPVYIQSASQTAKELQRAHDPIRGLADELEMERAYHYLSRAYALNEDPSFKDRLDNLGNKLSEYFLQQARRYLTKPLGSGAGLGWSYLEKALPYKASDLGAVRDEMTKGGIAYQIRSKLSIRVVFRDQTSRRDSAGFADQLADSIATNLESSGLPVKVIRPGETPAFEPNFQLVGDVLQHRPTKVRTSEPKDSEYRAGEREMPNPEWNKANREYESAGLELQTAQRALEGATAKGKKVKEANRAVAAAQQKVEDAHVTLDTIPRTVPADIVKPYTYTETRIDLGAVVQLQFRINDSSGTSVETNTSINRDQHQKFTVLENVKPEDTSGIKAQGTIPDEIQFLTDVENDARDELIKAVKEKVAELPTKILAQARQKAAEGDFEGAAESYSTPDMQDPEHQQAKRFLEEQFNISRTSKVSL